MPTGPRPEPPTRFCKLVYQGTWQDAVWANVMWLFLTGSGVITVPELNDLANECSDAYATRFLPHLNNSVVLNSTKVVLYAGGGDVFEGVASVGGTGGDTGSSMPANVATCITWQIAPHYRGGHPRTYLPGTPFPARNTMTKWTSSWITSITSAANSFHSDLEAISGVSSGITQVEHGVASFVRSNAWRTPPVFYRIASGTVDSRIDTQRRRVGRDTA